MAPRTWRALLSLLGDEQPTERMVMPMLRILDLSNNNGPVDMAAIARAGIAGVLLKLTEGTGFVDPLFAENWAAAGACALFRGAYHFAHLQEDAAAQAAYFAAHLPPLAAGDAAALDAEYPLTMNGDLSPWALAWLQRVEGALGFPPLLYSFTDFINRHLQAAQLARYPLWLASWGTFCPPSIGPWPSVALWQASDSATCVGVNGPVDESLIARDLAGLRALGKPGILTPPTSPLPTAGSYHVHVPMYLRALPKVDAPHVEPTVASPGEVLVTTTAPVGLPSWTSNWRHVCRQSTGALGYALAQNLTAAK